MNTAADISVACPSCGAQVSPGSRRCRACKTPISSDLRAELEERLEAASEEYRGARDTVRNSRVLVFMIAIVYAAIGALVYMFTRSSGLAPDRVADTAALEWLVETLVAAGIILGCAGAIGVAPRAGLVVTLALWLLYHAFVALADPARFLILFASLWGAGGLFMRIAVPILLLRALLAAVRAHRLRDRFTRGA